MGSNDGQMSHDKSLLLFRVGPFRFCVPATDVEAIIGMPAFRSLPNAPPSIQGVFSHRGQVATVINLRRKFGLEDHKDDTDGQLIMARISIGLTGFRVDEVMDITTSMEKDIIELSALKQSTRFDQVLVLGDQIIQCTEFELLYQAKDAPYRPEPKPSTDELPDDAPQPVFEKDTPQPDGGPEQESPAVPESTDRSGGEPDEKNPRDNAAETVAKAPPGQLKLPGTSSFTPKNQAAAPHKTSPRKAPRQFRPLAGMEPAGGKKTTGGIASGRIVSRPPERSTPVEQNIDWAPPKKRSGVTIAWILVLAAVVIALYLFWPKPEEKLQPQSTSDVSVAPVAAPATSSSDYARQNVTRAPSQPGSSRAGEETTTPTGPEKSSDTLPTGALEEKIETVSESLNDDASPVSEVNKFEAPEEPIEGEKPGTRNASADVNELKTPEKPAESEETETGNTSTDVPVPPEDASRFLTIETEEFTLSVEPGISETDESSEETTTTEESTTTSSAPPAPAAPPQPAETEYIHIVVKGDTLWDIAEEYLGDPFQYPQLAELSRIRDPDWIYPGDRVRIIIKNTSE